MSFRCISILLVEHTMLHHLYSAKNIHVFFERRRYPKGEKLPDCRETRSMGAIEIAMRRSATRKIQHIFQPVVGISFDSTVEAYEFYNLYSWEVGFGISYGNSDTNRGNQYRTMQELICCNAVSKFCLMF